MRPLERATRNPSDRSIAVHQVCRRARQSRENQADSKSQMRANVLVRFGLPSELQPRLVWPSEIAISRGPILFPPSAYRGNSSSPTPSRNLPHPPPPPPPHPNPFTRLCSPSRPPNTPPPP